MNISRELEKIGEAICEEYCKFPEQYGNSDEEMDRLCREKCDNCPLSRLF